MTDSETRDLARHILQLWPWMVLPLIPFVLALAALDLSGSKVFPIDVAQIDRSVFEVLEPEGSASTDMERDESDSTLEDFSKLTLFRAITVYLSIAIGQIVVCGALIAASVAAVRSAGGPARMGAAVTFGVLLVVLVAITALERERYGNALHLTYHNTCDLLLKSGVAPHLTSLPLPDAPGVMPQNCTEGTTSHLAYLAFIPMAVGLLAAAIAAAAASRVRSPLPAQASDWKAAYKARAEDLQIELYLTSAVLVTSTAALFQFYRLPLKTVTDEAFATGLTYYAEGMTLFWGTIFTLTMLAIYGPTAMALRRQLRQHKATEEDPAALADWVETLDVLSFRRRLRNVLAAVSPLLVGPIGAMLEPLLSLSFG